MSNQRSVLSTDKVDAEALAAITGFHSGVVEEVRNTVEKNTVVIVGMKQNPVVSKACSTLKAQGIPFKYLEYGSYLSMWKPRLAIKIWSGWPTFPQVFVQGKLIGGNREMQQWIKAGKLKK